MNPERTKAIVQLAVHCILFLSLLQFLYLPLLTGYFSADDISWIWFSATKSTGEIFFSPLEYRSISSNNFTPMLGLSFKIDWHLFGMKPEGYFFHAILATLAAGSALFLLIDLYTDRLTALAGFNLFLLNPIVLSVTGWNAARHYMEGMLFALLALYFFVRKDRTNQMSFASGLFFLLSLLCKEVYAVLPFIGILLSRSSFRQKIVNTLPMFVMLPVYALWRLWMLGGIGGYPFDNTVPSGTVLDGAVNVVAAFSEFLFNVQFALVALFIVIAAVTVRRSVLIKPGMCLVLLFLPILPVIGLVENNYGWSRYFFHISVFLVTVFVLWTRTNIGREDWRKIAAILISVAIAFLFLLRAIEVKTMLMNESMVARAVAAEYCSTGKLYIKQTEPAWFYDGLHDIYRIFYKREINTLVVPDDMLIPYLSHEQRQAMLSAGYPLTDHRKYLSGEHVLNGFLEVKGYRFSWSFGPYSSGRYFILKGRQSGLYTYLFPMKREATYQFGRYYPGNEPEIIYLRVLFRSPEGWETLSDEYRIEIPGDRRILL